MVVYVDSGTETGWGDGEEADLVEVEVAFYSVIITCSHKIYYDRLIW